MVYSSEYTAAPPSACLDNAIKHPAMKKQDIPRRRGMKRQRMAQRCD